MNTMALRISDTVFWVSWCVIMLIIMAMCSGCETLTVLKADGTEIRYTRTFTDLQIKRMTVETKSGTRVDVNGYNAQDKGHIVVNRLIDKIPNAIPIP